MSDQATLHWPPEQDSSPAQKKALLLLSIASMIPAGRIPAAIAWASIAVRTELTRRRRPQWEENARATLSDACCSLP
jgi:hypothetical protein